MFILLYKDNNHEFNKNKSFYDLHLALCHSLGLAGLGNADHPCVHVCVRNNLVGATLWITHPIQPFDIDLLSWFQQMAQMMKLNKGHIVLTLTFI